MSLGGKESERDDHELERVLVFVLMTHCQGRHTGTQGSMPISRAIMKKNKKIRNTYSVWACIRVFTRKKGEPATAPSTPAVAPVGMDHATTKKMDG